MDSVEFDLAIPSWDYQARYRGAVDVIVMATTGQRVRFPATMLQKFVSPEGVHGRFRLRFDNECRLIDITRLGPRVVH